MFRNRRLKESGFYHIIDSVMKMLTLQHPFISVLVGSGPSYGGGQQFSDNHMISRCGCGIIAAADTLLYLDRYHLYGEIPFLRELSASSPLPRESYNELIRRLRRRYFPMIPYAGINGIMLMVGMQRFFHDNAMPYTARWCTSRSRLWPRIEEMLREDLPVIMSVGPNFPIFWGNKRACFYVNRREEGLVPAANVKAHYFTVTGMDDKWLRISSWGRLYYLNRLEFEAYVTEHSAGFISNILYIQKK